MPDTSERLSVHTADAIEKIGRETWDRCAATGNPFVSYDFLHALEAGGCVNSKTGWLAQHAVLEDEAGEVLGVAPMYLKNHSYGEYVFDHGWADAYERAGGRYYPKLQVSAPFSPVMGPRLLAAPGPNRPAVQRTLIAALIQIAEQVGVTNLHITFPTEEEAEIIERAGLLLRRGFQYHWFNDGFTSFDDFLARLASRKRKAVRKERREVADAGITMSRLTGEDLKPHHWEVFHRFYTDTYDRKWGFPYLTRDFFQLLSETMPDRVVLIWAERDGTPIAGALNLKGDDALFGRNWGCAGDYKFLHFETCYYQAIDFAIEHGLKRVEAGTQGPHKVQRGYVPVQTYSGHWVRDAGFRNAIERFLDDERRSIEYEMEAMARHSPFRQTENDPIRKSPRTKN